ncbi:MAG: universal stress protein [Candidatus Dormibacteria bacterium]
MPAVRIVIWVVEGTWQGCIDAASHGLPSGAQVALLHVTPSDVAEVASAATTGLLGRAFAGRRAVRSFQDVADGAASELLAAAAARLGRQDAELLRRRGRVEREVIRAVVENVDLLVVARDGDHSRLGPHSLGPATRFVVDHAPCAVLLVWPDEPPGIESIPPPPPPGHHPPPYRD